MGHIRRIGSGIGRGCDAVGGSVKQGTAPLRTVEGTVMRDYFVIDAFTDRKFGGNAAAVVLDADGLSEGEMQSLAAEFNLSETTFVLRPQSASADVRFRWMTPTIEVSMCGHATLAGLRALVEVGRIPEVTATAGAQLAIETRSGVLQGFVERMPGEDGALMFWLDLPDPTLTEFAVARAELAALLRVSEDVLVSTLPAVRTQDGDAIVFVQDTAALFDMRPDFAALGQWQKACDLRGLCVATTNTLTPSIHVQSRFFVPSLGIDEDPVTGSVHGPLAAYLVHHELIPLDNGTAGMCCAQAKCGGRGGVVYALVQRNDPHDSHDACDSNDSNGYSVRIGGHTEPVMRGRLL